MTLNRNLRNSQKEWAKKSENKKKTKNAIYQPSFKTIPARHPTKLQQQNIYWTSAIKKNELIKGVLANIPQKPTQENKQHQTSSRVYGFHSDSDDLGFA